MKRVISYIIGGLGNQLFQYAVGLAAAKQNSAEPLLDITAFSWYRRPYALDSFRISSRTTSNLDRLRMLAWHGRYSPLKLFDKRRPAKTRAIRIDPGGYLYAPELLDMGPRNIIWLVGYWQNEKYFLPVREQLLKEFTLRPELSVKNTPLGKHIMSSESVAVHIRRGDNIQKPDGKNPTKQIPQLGMVSKTYIANAIQHIQTSRPNASFFVFSDEIDWVRDNMVFPCPVSFVDNASLSDVQQFELMSLCRHQIIANSTFSWWAAWLNDNPEKIVCAPKQWDERVADYDTGGLLPLSWHLIE